MSGSAAARQTPRFADKLPGSHSLQPADRTIASIKNGIRRAAHALQVELRWRIASKQLRLNELDSYELPGGEPRDTVFRVMDYGNRAIAGHSVPTHSRILSRMSRQRIGYLRPISFALGVLLLLAWWFEPVGPVAGRILDPVIAVALISLSVPSWTQRRAPDR